MCHAAKEDTIPNREAPFMKSLVSYLLDHQLVHEKLGRRNKKRLASWVSSLSGSKVFKQSTGLQKAQEKEI